MLQIPHWYWLFLVSDIKKKFFNYPRWYVWKWNLVTQSFRYWAFQGLINNLNSNCLHGNTTISKSLYFYFVKYFKFPSVKCFTFRTHDFNILRIRIMFLYKGQSLTKPWQLVHAQFSEEYKSMNNNEIQHFYTCALHSSIFAKKCRQANELSVRVLWKMGAISYIDHNKQNFPATYLYIEQKIEKKQKYINKRYIV